MVRDHHAGLVQRGGPLQFVARLAAGRLRPNGTLVLAALAPCADGAVVQRQGHARDAGGLVGVDVEALLQVAHRVVTDVVGLDAVGA